MTGQDGNNVLRHWRSFLRLTRPQGSHWYYLSDASILTTALPGRRFFGGNLVAARRYMQ